MHKKCINFHGNAALQHHVSIIARDGWQNFHWFDVSTGILPNPSIYTVRFRTLYFLVTGLQTATKTVAFATKNINLLSFCFC